MLLGAYPSPFLSSPSCCPYYLSKQQEERQALLHEGAGSAAVNAFVEVVFDNSDNRFALENSDEVVLRRTIGPKKDEFFLQRKRATKQEISSLLEGAGFSKSNPYFMIQQGKIQDICTMRDNERLALLKQVAGTTVYDEKKQESLTKMEENLSSIDKISSILEDIEKRLQELHGEKEELTNYQQLDRKRRAMEYTLYDKELRRARKALEELEHERSNHVEFVSKLHENAKNTHDSIRNIEGVMKAKANAFKRNKKILQDLEADKTIAVKQLTTLKLECRELEESIKNGENQQQSNYEELQKLQVEIAKAQDELTSQVQPQYEEATKLLQKLTHDMDQTKRQAAGLHEKQGRGSHFQTKGERDAYLQSNIQEMKDNKVEKETTLADMQQSLLNLREAASKDEEAVEKVEEEISKTREQHQTHSKNLDTKKRQRLEVHESRQQAWRKKDEFAEAAREARESCHRARVEFRECMPFNVRMGVESLEKIVDQEGLVKGVQYFGMVMDNFELKGPQFQIAVETAAANSLFHIIVDTDETAARLMKILDDKKLGRLTFLPLNRLRIETVQFPENLPSIRPMIQQCLTYEDNVARAIEHVFNKKAIAQSLDMAAEWSSRLGMDVITLEGDLSSHKGSLTGGYIDSGKSKMKARNKYRAAEKESQAAERKFRESEHESQQAEQDATNIQKEVHQLEAKDKAYQRKLKDNERDADKLKKRISKSKKQEETIEAAISPLKLEIEGIKTDIQRLQEEMKTDLKSTLSAEEKQLIASLKEAEKKLASDIEKQTQEVSRIGLERQRLQSLLDDNLLRRQQELQGLSAPDDDEEDSDLGFRATFAAKVAQMKDDLEQKIMERDGADRVMHDVESRLEEAREAEQRIRGELTATKQRLEKLKSADSDIKKELEAAQDESDKKMTKVSIAIMDAEIVECFIPLLWITDNYLFLSCDFSYSGKLVCPNARLTRLKSRNSEHSLLLQSVKALPRNLFLIL